MDGEASGASLWTLGGAIREIDRLRASIAEMGAERQLFRRVADAACAAMSEAHENHPEGWMLQHLGGQRLSDALDALEAVGGFSQEDDETEGE